MFLLNYIKIVTIFSLGHEVVLCVKFLADEREILYLLIFFTFYKRFSSYDFIGLPESSLDCTQEMLLQDFLSYFLKRWFPVTYIEQYVFSLEF